MKSTNRKSKKSPELLPKRSGISFKMIPDEFKNDQGFLYEEIGEHLGMNPENKDAMPCISSSFYELNFY
jgi:hypothetical protein